MKKLTAILAAIVVAFSAGRALAVVKVVASIPDLASIANYVGGDRVSAFAIANGKDNPHTVEVLPSYMVKVSRADVYLKVGFQLDQWAAGIIDGSRNGRLKAVDCSEGVTALEKPVGRVSAELGDVHPDGNPHYWCDPARAAIAAHNIAEALASVDPDGATIYRANAARFADEAAKKAAGWKQRLAGAAAHPIVTYHRSWAYFVDAFGFEQAGYIEPIPGIPPTASHLNDLLGIIKSRGVKLVLEESFYPPDAGKFIERQTDVKVIVADASCDGVGPNDYFDHIESLVKQMESVR